MSRDVVVVIGAGLSGLAAALRLCNGGREVVVLEAGAHAGGCCSTADVDGFRFNNGALYVATPSLLRHAFARLDLDLDACVRLHRIVVPQLSVLDSGTRVFTTTADGSWVEGDDKRTARLRAELGDLHRRWRPIYRELIERVLPYELSLPRALARLWRYLPKLSGTVATLLERRFADAEVRAAVGAITLYTGLAPQRTPVTQIVGLLALLEEGFFLPEGGMGSIPAAIQRRLLAAGATLRLNARVQRIEYRDGRLLGVRLADGERVTASTVVATNSALDVVANLLDPALMPSRLQRHARRAPLSHRAISIQLGVAPAAGFRAPAFAVNHVPLLDQQHRFHVPPQGVPRWYGYTNPTTVLPDLAPEGNAIIEMFAPAPPKASAAAIGADEVAEIAGRYIDAVSAEMPFRTLGWRVAGPADFVRERHLYEGALYGLSPGAAPADYFPRAAGLPGLYLAGQTTYPGYGVPTAMLSGLHAADAILRARR